MITDADIEKLEKVFATKKELSQWGLDIMENMEKILTDFAQDFSKRLVMLEKRMNERMDAMEKRLTIRIDNVENGMNAMEKRFVEMHMMQPVVANHEERIWHLEGQMKKTKPLV